MHDSLFQSIAFAVLGGRPDVPSGVTQWKLTSCSCQARLGCPLLGGASAWSLRGLRLQGPSPSRSSELSPFSQRGERGAGAPATARHRPHPACCQLAPLPQRAVHVFLRGPYRREGYAVKNWSPLFDKLSELRLPAHKLILFFFFPQNEVNFAAHLMTEPGS